MTPDLVIFDCDGVLVDSEPIANPLLAEALNEAGYAITPGEAVDRFTGRSMTAVVRAVEADRGAPLPADFLSRLQARTFDALRARLAAIPGVADALARIAVPKCVASSGEPDKIALSLSVTGLARFFDGRVFSAAMVARGKPHPDLFLHAARVMGARPARTVVVEDSLPGVEAARAAGMRVLGFTGGGHSGPALARALAAAGAELFASMADLPDLVEAPRAGASPTAASPTAAS